MRRAPYTHTYSYRSNPGGSHQVAAIMNREGQTMDYNTTINLPKTEFSMRAGLPKKEPLILKKR